MPACSIGGILPVPYASSICGANQSPTVPPSGNTRLARNSLSNVVMPDSTASSLALMISSRCPPALPASLLPRRLLCGRGPSGVPRRSGEIVDRRHHQHDLHPPSGHVERYERAVAPSVM